MDESRQQQRHRREPCTFAWDGRRSEVGPRDGRRKKTYRAEGVAERVVGKGKGYATIEDCKKRVDVIVKSKTWERLRKRFGLYRRTGGIDVKKADNCRSFSYGGLITLGSWDEQTILHELAHEICPRGLHHHWPWVNVYLSLIARFRGAKTSHVFRESFRAARIPYNPPPRRAPLSDEQKAVLVARLRKARQDKAMRERAASGPLIIAVVQRKERP